jgi:hypothetical protein
VRFVGGYSAARGKLTETSIRPALIGLYNKPLYLIWHT